ncbi:TetR/AcrR family transcriptional regulator [Conexibacter sp. DBS9H8]|uniref:TetR/AcrR family transcriptional regulator n=1 Tax=Conexibacter sp. DBS9H8 TaxID=2937801 RepID=UPI00200F1241|nr:TetR family transcriptional regulator [Conexibacter sp. DBS9H8]
MSLDRARIIAAASTALRDRGLAGLSMRTLAQDLGVQPGALYHYVASKQELLVAVGEQILADSAAAISTADPAQAALDIRAALLPIRDGAEVLSFVHAYKPDAVGPFRDLHRTLAPPLDEPAARLVAEALIRYVLGWVAVEQNRAELVRARILDPEAARPASADTAAFRFGVDALLGGLSSRTR